MCRLTHVRIPISEERVQPRIPHCLPMLFQAGCLCDSQTSAPKALYPEGAAVASVPDPMWEETLGSWEGSAQCTFLGGRLRFMRSQRTDNGGKGGLGAEPLMFLAQVIPNLPINATNIHPTSTNGSRCSCQGPSRDSRYFHHTYPHPGVTNSCSSRAVTWRFGPAQLRVRSI